MTHIYAFGSICRGDVSIESDVDLLALVEKHDDRFDPKKFSIYSYGRIQELWDAGNAFAWHLALESKLIYASRGEDFLKSLGMPSGYASARDDCKRLIDIFDAAFEAIQEGTPSVVFELSTIFLSIRNMATCFSLARLPHPIFSRNSAKRLGEMSIQISDSAYSVLMRSRILSTRGIGQNIEEADIVQVLSELNACRSWMKALKVEVEENGSIR